MSNSIFTYIFLWFGIFFVSSDIFAQSGYQRHSQVLSFGQLRTTNSTCPSGNFTVPVFRYTPPRNNCQHESLMVRVVATSHAHQVVSTTATAGVNPNTWTGVVGISQGCATTGINLTVGEEWNSHQPVRQTFIDSKVINTYNWQQNPGFTLTLSAPLTQDGYVEFEWYTTSSSPLEGVKPFNFSTTLLKEKATSLLYWDYVEGAANYEVEWVFWDAYSEASLLFPHAPGTLQTYFLGNPAAVQTSMLSSIAPSLPFIAKEPVRIVTSNQHFELPLTYPAGILFYRVRPVGYWEAAVSPLAPASTTPRERKVGAWQYHKISSTAPSGTVSALAQPTLNYTVLAKDFEATKLWQVVTTFAEEGKFKKVVSYLDGTSRMRQTVTHLNSDATVLVAEQFYSAEGAASVQILPTPLQAQGLHYRDNVNYFAVPHPNDATQAIATRHKRAYEGRSAVLHKAYGAGLYYSANNPFLKSSNPIHRWYSQFTPDANGYALSQTVMTNDNTQKVVEQGGVGETFAIGGAHSTKYYYGTAAGNELENLFGDNVGSIRHYRKSLVKDANGQVSISYTNQEGKTIATALSDPHPANLKSLDNATQPQSIVVDLDKDYTSTSADGVALFTEFNLLNSNPHHQYQFTYTNNLPTTCKDCSYTVSIKIIDNTTQLPAQQLMSDGSLAAINIPDILLGKQASGNPIENGSWRTTSLQLPVGSYTIRKLITVTNPEPWAVTKAGIKATASNVPSLQALTAALHENLAATGQCTPSFPASGWVAAYLTKKAEDQCSSLPEGKEQFMCQKTLAAEVFVQSLFFIKNWTDAKEIFGDNLGHKFYEVDNLFSHPIYGKPFIPAIQGLLSAMVVSPTKPPVTIDEAMEIYAQKYSYSDAKKWEVFRQLYLEARAMVYQKALVEAKDPAYTGLPYTPPSPPNTIARAYWTWRNEHKALFFNNDPVPLAASLSSFIVNQCSSVNGSALQAALVEYYTHINTHTNEDRLLSRKQYYRDQVYAIFDGTCPSSGDLQQVIFTPPIDIPQFYAPLLAGNITPSVLEQTGDNTNATPFVQADYYLQTPSLPELDKANGFSVEFVLDHFTSPSINSNDKRIDNSRIVPLVSRKLKGSYQYAQPSPFVNPLLPGTPPTTTMELPYYFSMGLEYFTPAPIKDFARNEDGSYLLRDGRPIPIEIPQAPQHRLVVSPFWFSPTIWKNIVSYPNTTLALQLHCFAQFKHTFEVPKGIQVGDQIKVVWLQKKCSPTTNNPSPTAACKIITGYAVYVNGKLLGEKNFSSIFSPTTGT
jgi:hypothetical protein